ncbi:ATP-binding protein [Evansella sp. AB-rgal1]|uniref:ATP-binding protein n=1 Tax=Evansella sp. AB-rgal1 TaxID=3242696 RepID=UPI00359D479C
MSIKTKLYIAFSSVLAIIIIVGVLVLLTYNQQRDHMTSVVNENYERVKLANQLARYAQGTSREVREILLVDDSDMTRDNIAELRELASDSLDTLSDLSLADQSLIRDLTNYFHDYNDFIDNILVFVERGNGNVALEHLTSNREIRENLLLQVDELVLREETEMESAILGTEVMIHNALLIFLSLITITVIVIIGITFQLTKNINKTINKVRDVMIRVPSSSMDDLPRIEDIRQDEIGDIAVAYNTMADSLEKISKNEKELNESLLNENWIDTNFAYVTAQIQGIQDLQQFSEILLKTVAPIVSATNGVVYITNDRKVLVKGGAFAGNHSNIGQEKFYFGEGLVGQCASDNKMMNIDSLPNNYISTNSGLGVGTPTSLIICPIPFENGVIGVLELAKFEPFTTLQIQFLERVCHSIGISINSIQDHIKISELLIESQTTTEELQTQSEELQQQQEELRMINEKLHEQYKQSDEKTKELEKIRLDLEQRNRDIQLGSKYKTEFLANMSHELRTPLNSILILSQLLHENSEKNLTDTQVQHADTIYSSGKDLLNLINDILDLSKIESGKIEVFPEEVLIEDIKAFVERRFSFIAEQKGIEFTILISENAPSCIVTDDQRLKQILNNLLSNAFKFTDEGKVSLAIKEGIEGDTSKIIFTVTDTGIGITEEKQKNIFDAFYQGDGTTTRKYGGTGLGLSISKNLSKVLGGDLNVISNEGTGSTFYLYLQDYCTDTAPFITEVAATTDVEEEKLIPTNHPVKSNKSSVQSLFIKEEANRNITTKGSFDDKVVLVVDDDMRNIFALTAALEKHNMKVIFAENGKEAITTLRENSAIDIVLMDIMMPVMDGYEAMKMIRDYEEYRELPIIALTAKAMKHDKEKCIEAGASDYISKPVDMEQLLSLIKVWVYK